MLNYKRVTHDVTSRKDGLTWFNQFNQPKWYLRMESTLKWVWPLFENGRFTPI
jgi:hypothetical protein